MDGFNILLAFGQGEQMGTFRVLLLFLYGGALLWLMLVEAFRLKIEKSLHRGFFEFHLLSLPLVALACLFFKIQALPNSPDTMLVMYPHLVILGLLFCVCALEWRISFLRKKNYANPV